MDISVYFNPIQLSGFQLSEGIPGYRIGDIVNAFIDPGNFPDLNNADIAILGVNEDRNAVENEGCSQGADHIRTELYRLFNGNAKLNIIDLGNMLQGHTISDTYFALTAVITELLARNIFPIILGGGQDLTFANYKAYEELGKIINIAAIDPRFDMGNTEEEIDSRSYLSKIILQQPNYLFNFTNLGYQSYFVEPEAINLMKNLYFDTYRLGDVRADLEITEPIVRNADLLSIDVAAIKMSDAPGNKNAVPNGFYGEEMCKIIRYAGLSDKLSSLGIYEYNPQCDLHHQTAQLIAQMIWYFLEGFYNRKHDYPKEDQHDYIKFTVAHKDFKDEILFYKSKKSDRWWMKVPVNPEYKDKYERHYMVPCSYQDYQTACNDQIPDRWWQTYQKLM